MAYILLKESSMQFYMHFHEACKKPSSRTINTTILWVEWQWRWLSILLYHVPAMCNIKLNGTHAHAHTPTHIHTHTHTLLGWFTHWTDPETIYHWNTCHDREGGVAWAWGWTRINISLKVWYRSSSSYQ